MRAVSREEIPIVDVYVLQGDDDLGVQDDLKALYARLREDGGGELDVDALDGHACDQSALTQALTSLSLFSPQRAVVLADALDVLKKKEDGEWLAVLLPNLPQNTHLVLLLPDSQRYSKGDMVWQKVKPNHWLRKSLKDSGCQVVWREHPLPSQREMPAWIMNEAQRQAQALQGEVRFDSRAAAELANLVGSNLFQARQEISKALSYVGEGGTVTREDVRLLCSQSREEDIFEMVDAVGGRNAKHALSLLQRLLDDMPAQYIYTMLARQVRLLIMAREVLEAGGGQNDMAAQAGLNPFVAKKALAQCRHFNMGELEDLYRRLDRMDEESKTGVSSLDVAMETLVADISR
ncbi:MAG: polymerase subunit delta [Chloroflexota bacterium]|nr:polymerase subunit delta [Chloroflexota bacterium]